MLFSAGAGDLSAVTTSDWWHADVAAGDGVTDRPPAPPVLATEPQSFRKDILSRIRCISPSAAFPAGENGRHKETG